MPSEGTSNYRKDCSMSDYTTDDENVKYMMACYKSVDHMFRWMIDHHGAEGVKCGSCEQYHAAVITIMGWTYDVTVQVAIAPAMRVFDLIGEGEETGDEGTIIEARIVFQLSFKRQNHGPGEPVGVYSSWQTFASVWETAVDNERWQSYIDLRMEETWLELGHELLKQARAN